MANILDYLDWRGDIPVSCDGFNEVDNLILSKLVYIDFADIVPAPGKGRGVPLRSATDAFFAARGPVDDMGVLVPDDIIELLRRAAQTARFGGMRLDAYEAVLDEEKEEQFAAVSFDCGDGTLYCAFRGTDDTLVGWKEDLNLGFMEVIPSQKHALDYLTGVARRHRRKGLRVGGHSKGGNLAVYSAVFAPEPVQKRIVQIYDNDGPGFNRDLTGTPEYKRVARRILALKPQASVIGQLLEHSRVKTVVYSTGSGVGQHNGFTWEVRGNAFVHMAELSREGKRNEDTLDSVAEALSIPQRQAFVEALYEVLTGTGARTLSDLNEEKLHNAAGMLKTYRDLDAPTRQALFDAFKLLFKHGAKNFMRDVRTSQGHGVDGLLRWVDDARRRLFDQEPRHE